MAAEPSRIDAGTLPVTTPWCSNRNFGITLLVVALALCVFSGLTAGEIFGQGHETPMIAAVLAATGVVSALAGFFFATYE